MKKEGTITRAKSELVEGQSVALGPMGRRNPKRSEAKVARAGVNLLPGTAKKRHPPVPMRKAAKSGIRPALRQVLQIPRIQLLESLDLEKVTARAVQGAAR